MRLLGFDRHERWVALKALLAVGVAIAGVALVVVGVGGVDVAADKPHSWLTYRVLHFAFGQSVGLRASSTVPPDDLDSMARVRLGAQHFHLVCSNCHGGPGLGQSPLALSMEPRPQHLPAVVGQFDDAELFWILKHGVKFSAMPAWSTRTRDDEVWSTVAFVRKLPTMTAAQYLALTTPPPAPPGGAPAVVPPFAPPAALRPADTARNPSWQAPEEYLYAVPALGFGDRAAMSNAVALCGRCHGADGTGGVTGGEAPDLTLQDPEYLRASLEAYATGGRRSGYMQPIAAQLSEPQIAALADWYANLPRKPASAATPNAGIEARGGKIATEGLTSLALPACATCHAGEARARIGAPRLEGQSAIYIRRQLAAMRDRDRGSTRFWNPMPAVAGHLTDADMEAVAAYYASQAPATQAPAPSLASQGADGDRAKGEGMFGAICARCHTPQALGDEAGDIPDLTLQLPRYVASALRAYRAGERQNTRMHLVAQDLDDGEIAALAAYVGSLDPQAARTPASAGSPERGAAIVEHGIPDRKVPACLTCHEAGMTTALPLIPRLSGQNAAYLRKKLDYFAGPQADGIGLLNPMPPIARSLTEAERADLAAFFAADRPAEKQPAAN